jgi:DNA replication and repair protein RecF
VVLTGPNGAGKTNVLEALSLLSPGRGLRSVKLSQITNLNAETSSGLSWVIGCQIWTQSTDHFLATGLDLSVTGSERRVVKINHTLARSQTELTDYFGVVWVTPEMGTLFSDASSQRRKFIDRMVAALDSQHAPRLYRYDHYIRERSTLLREGRHDSIWLDQLEKNIAEAGIAIAIARQQFVKSLEISQVDALDSPFPKFNASMSGLVDTWCHDSPALEAEQKLAKALTTSRLIDSQGGASFGPHKSDLSIVHLAKGLPAELCSTGEQKMLLMALILGFVKHQTHQHQRNVIVLLDDVVAHLDETHRSYLLNELQRYADGQNSLQIWLTGTSADEFGLLNHRAQFVHIEQATIING